MGIGSDQVVAELFAAERERSGRSAMRTGKVVSVNAAVGTVAVEISGVTIPDLPYHASLSPVVGKMVWLLDQGPWMAVIGAAAATGQGGSGIVGPPGPEGPQGPQGPPGPPGTINMALRWSDFVDP